MKKITPKILKTWKPCTDGYKRFCELLPKGGTLKECIDALVADGHDSWGKWLFNKCQMVDDFKEQTLCGYGNSGDRNSGNWNSGHGNSGNWNSGDGNSGHGNSGYGNSGNWNSGCFNTDTPPTVRVFNKDIPRVEWESAAKPDFINNVNLCLWVSESEMTDQEKIENPHFYTTGGYLKKKNYKQAWADAYATAAPKDIKLLKALPNFDATLFKEITGVEVN